MIKATAKFRRKKLTLDQKAMKTAVTKVSKETKDAVRREMPYITGALYYSIINKVRSDKQSNAYAVIGAKAHYEKMVGGISKIPNKYIGKIEEIYNVLHQYTGAPMLAKIRQAVQEEIAKMKGQL